LRGSYASNRASLVGSRLLIGPVSHTANTFQGDRRGARIGSTDAVADARRAARVRRLQSVVLPAALRWLGFFAVSIWLSWPLAEQFSIRIAGEYGDPFQTLWSWRWLHDAIVELRNPFFTDRAYYPHGGSLVFQTFDIPTALLTLPLWNVLPPVAIYNCGIMFAFWMSAYGMYLLAFELTRDRLAAFCAGVLFTACPYHVAHATASQHLASMGWLPIYFLYLNRIASSQSRPRDGVLAGLFLALASLASWYHLLFALIGSVVLIAQAAIRKPRATVTKLFLTRALGLAATYLVIAGPLLVAIFLSKSQQQIAGAHDPRTYSGDLYEFFYPNAVQAWADWWGGHFVHWTGNSAENALYMGYSVLFFALLAPFLRDTRARGWILVALLGAVFALGPVLQIDGVVGERALPYSWLVHALPQLEFMGVPVRFGYLLYLGMIVCWTFTITRLRQLARKRALRTQVTQSAWRAQCAAVCYSLLALVPLSLGLLEYQPGPFNTTEAVIHPPMLEWARDRSKFAVLDLSGAGWMHWHATLHRKPTTWGYLTRVPAWLEDWYDNLPVVRALLHPKRLPMTPKLERVDEKIDFAWGEQAPAPSLRPSFYRVAWNATLLVPRVGAWTFYLSSDDGSRLSLDGEKLIDTPREHPMQTFLATRELNAGAHSIEVLYEQLDGEAGVRLEWQGPGQPRQVVPREAFRGLRGAPGLSGVYSQGGKICALDAATAQLALRELSVRYVITADSDNECLERGFELSEIYRARGIRIWQVPK
jgi:PA14 domain